MKTEIIKDFNVAIEQLQNHRVIALPAEACFGLSALPSNDTVNQILMLKGRLQSKGLILVGHQLEVFKDWIDDSQLTDEHQKKLNAKYDKPTTWIVPSKVSVPKYITGNFNSIAIRITKHPVLAYLSKTLNSVLISTSANLQGQPPAITVDEVLKYFEDKISGVFDAQIGSAQSPSQIIDLISNEVIRR
ncbi:MAG: tRNA threonylcarbamoyladenosine biosynthesis protein RimN [Gammaproteobacteria bacterium]|nr:MAG: tRNA threonylcarbamoyladenosine biosynthesis protein RimN [Gammaproteobacteria bacterium]UTW43041.1 Sua5/YciO/YrdC/YwlC family protein [bacterium SCSIO 12844]